MLSQSLRNPVDQLKTPLNPARFHLTLAPNVSRPIIPLRQATALRSGLLEGTRWAGCVQAPRRWITRTAPHHWIVGRSARGDPIGCARLLAHHWLREKNVVIGPKRKPSSGWAVELRHFFCNVCSVFCERAGSVFLHRFLHHLLCFLWTCWLFIFASFFESFALFFVNMLALYFCIVWNQLTLHSKWPIFKGQINFYHAKWPQTIQKLSLFVHII